ncbi:hypothetical protein FHG87_010753 [Trinorchestia longiramus]|nr:hypothetical protein FHG87_010753 [Trinorchestia longiramus]
MQQSITGHASPDCPGCPQPSCTPPPPPPPPLLLLLPPPLPRPPPPLLPPLPPSPPPPIPLPLLPLRPPPLLPPPLHSSPLLPPPHFTPSFDPLLLFLHMFPHLLYCLHFHYFSLLLQLLFLHLPQVITITPIKISLKLEPKFQHPKRALELEFLALNSNVKFPELEYSTVSRTGVQYCQQNWSTVLSAELEYSTVSGTGVQYCQQNWSTVLSAELEYSTVSRTGVQYCQQNWSTVLSAELEYSTVLIRVVRTIKNQLSDIHLERLDCVRCSSRRKLKFPDVSSVH